MERSAPRPRSLQDVPERYIVDILLKVFLCFLYFDYRLDGLNVIYKNYENMPMDV